MPMSGKQRGRKVSGLFPAQGLAQVLREALDPSRSPSRVRTWSEFSDEERMKFMQEHE